MTTKYLVIRKPNCYALSIWNSITKDHFILDRFDSLEAAHAVRQHYDFYVPSTKGVAN